MFLARRAPDHVAGADFFDRGSPALNQAAASRDDEGLPQRVRVPRRPGAGLEGDTDAERPRRVGCLEQRVDADRAGEVLGGSLSGGLSAAPLDVHTASFLYSLCVASPRTPATTT